MKCELHKESSDLQESHIIPNFVINWMKRTGNKRLRQLGNFNQPLQDGVKKKMLCADCEQLFSRFEDEFKRAVFDPYLNDSSSVVKNTKELRLFCLSVLWRVLKLFKDDGNNYRFKDNLDQIESEWSDLLLNHQRKNVTGDRIHLILVDIDQFSGISPKIDNYFSRVIDIDICESETMAFVYAKFAQFIIFGEVCGVPDGSFENTDLGKVDTLSSKNQQMHNQGFTDFLLQRKELIKGWNDLSESQKLKNEKFHNKRKTSHKQERV